MNDDCLSSAGAFFRWGDAVPCCSSQEIFKQLVYLMPSSDGVVVKMGRDGTDTLDGHFFQGSSVLGVAPDEREEAEACRGP